MPEPIAVAFVEVRPEVDDFKANATTELTGSAQATSGLAAGNERLAASTQRVKSGLVEEQRQLRVTANEEEDLIRIRSRRAQTVGPLRLAGLGLGVGTALFAATRALGQLTEGLTVTGNEALTTQGRMRNLGAAILSGDVVGAFTALNDRTRDYSTAAVLAIDNSKELAKSLKDAGIALDEIGGLAESRVAALQSLSKVPQFIQTRVAQAQFEGDDTKQVAALQRADQIFAGNMEKIRSTAASQEQKAIALAEVFRQRKAIADQLASIAKTSRPNILEPLVEAVTDARLTGDSSKIIAALRAEKARLEEVIDSAKTNAADRAKFKDDLVGVNKDIETTQAAVVAEEQRHRQAMIDKTLDVGVLEDLQAQAAGGSGGAGRAARAAAIQAALDRGTIDGKKLTRAEKEAFNEELVNINSAIETEQDAITAENKRHADAIAQKQDDADRSFLAALSGREGRARNAQVIAQATAGLADDIKTSETLQRIFRESIAAVRKTVHDAALRASTIATLTSELLAETQSEAALRQQQRRARVDRREEALDLNIQIAEANDNKAAEKRAHEAKIAFLQERIDHTRRGTNQRKRLILEIRQEQAALRDLAKEADEAKKKDKNDGASFAQLSANFLQQRRGFLSDIAGNVQPTGGIPGLLPPTPPETFKVPSPLARDDKPLDPGKATKALREQAGTPASQGQLETLISISRNTNRLLNEIKKGVGHQDAKTARALSRAAGQIGGV